MPLILEPVLEATAAASSALRRQVSGRRLYVVVDVGAGTTDFGAFLVVETVDGDVKISPIKGTNMALKQAGDSLDMLLLSVIEKKESIPHQGPENRMLTWKLKRAMRQNKEILFDSGQLTYELTDDRGSSIRLDEFLDDDGVRKFSRSLQDKFGECLKLIDTSYLSVCDNKVAVVLTGG